MGISQTAWSQIGVNESIVDDRRDSSTFRRVPREVSFWQLTNEISHILEIQLVYHQLVVMILKNPVSEKASISALAFQIEFIKKQSFRK